MIVFDLLCKCGCSFEGWFQDREHFDNQLKSSYLECPECGGREIRKILSPIRFQLSDGETETSRNQNSSDSVPTAEIQKALETIQKFVEANFDDVGPDLATEALKMHYGVTKPRNIRGVATDSEEKELQEEGISLLKIPMPGKGDKTN